MESTDIKMSHPSRYLEGDLGSDSDNSLCQYIFCEIGQEGASENKC